MEEYKQPCHVIESYPNYSADTLRLYIVAKTEHFTKDLDVIRGIWNTAILWHINFYSAVGNSI
jgi:hypothetical protein